MDIIAFDADDTLWHTEQLYSRVQQQVHKIVSNYYSGDDLLERLNQIEIHNLQYYGYGIKSFLLSLIESSIEITGGKISGSELKSIIDLAKGMLTSEIAFIDHAEETVKLLAENYPLMLITKGDLFEQDAKVIRSGLKPYFRWVEIVSDKNHEGYADLIQKYGLDASRFWMVGNSMRSDILPVLELGGRAVYIPYAGGWFHEDADPPQNTDGRFFEIENIGLLPELIEKTLRGS